MVNRKNKYMKDKFQGAVNSRDGFAIEDCLEAHHWHLMEFLVLVLHSEKPTRVTITLGNTIFSSFSGDRKVDWAQIVSNLVLQLVSRVKKRRAMLVCPYLFHFFKKNQLFRALEKRD